MLMTAGWSILATLYKQAYLGGEGFSLSAMEHDRPACLKQKQSQNTHLQPLTECAGGGMRSTAILHCNVVAFLEPANLLLRSCYRDTSNIFHRYLRKLIVWVRLWWQVLDSVLFVGGT